MKSVELANVEGLEEGFTLIELVIAFAIIGILVAIGIPAFGAIQHTSRGNAMAGNSQAVEKEYLIELTNQGVSLTAADWNRAQAVQDEVFMRYYETYDFDADWGMTMKMSHDYSTDEVAYCFITYDREAERAGNPFSRSSGTQKNAGCQDEG
ncbi:prepilin-type N-terminal cleavage/methylation domain-containing protein [Microbacterium enclense]|uniref:type II secretion system protein n=1 Tax=Microbacterium enclense TaxID=993073 RepID=UPI00203D44BA|nr:prepilin-type N-terminal cleavage/methylation domain-containing protein [Microbacterium enclense]MCM3615714.1 prepilin-type N-terminal cleavage/methylation domain-containing protein [Microbacterium enclense]